MRALFRRGCYHDALHRQADHGFQKHGRAKVVSADIAGNLVHRLTDADFGRQMDDGTNTL
jgi:hypothetical protein